VKVTGGQSRTVAKLTVCPNTGFARVDTAPTSKPQQTVQVGTLAPVFVWSPQPRRISGGLLGTACDREVVHP
jgi:hypothetical protein